RDGAAAGRGRAVPQRRRHRPRRIASPARGSLRQPRRAVPAGRSLTAARDRTRARLLSEVSAVMGKIGTIAFGGPAVHVAMLRDEVVTHRHWVEDQEFLDLFGTVSVLPGPSSTQLAIVLSRRRAGWLGLVVGGACFIAPAMIIVLTLAWAYTHYATTPTGSGLLYGVEPVVVAVVAVALWQLAGTALKRRWFIVIAAGAAAAYFAAVN